MTEFGAYIRKARESRGWSLREADKRLGLHHSRLHELESGKSSKTGKKLVPTQDNLEKLAKGYNLPIDHLFALAYFPSYLKVDAGMSGEELGVVDLYRSLTPERKKFWLTIGEGLKTIS